MSSRSKAEHWAEELEAVAGRIAPQFGRAEPRRRALTYLQGLLAPLGRKNGWHLAEAAGDCSPHGMQEFLSRVHWDADALRDDLRAYVVEHRGDEDAVLVLDETGFLKKGMCGRPLRCKKNLWTAAALDRVLPCVRPLLRRLTGRGPVWEFVDQVHITEARSKRSPFAWFS